MIKFHTRPEYTGCEHRSISILDRLDVQLLLWIRSVILFRVSDLASPASSSAVLHFEVPEPHYCRSDYVRDASADNSRAVHERNFAAGSTYVSSGE